MSVDVEAIRARGEASRHGLSDAVADELAAKGWVAHQRGVWQDVAARACDSDRLRAGMSRLADLWERESQAGGEYAEIRRVHAAALREALRGGRS